MSYMRYQDWGGQAKRSI